MKKLLLLLMLMFGLSTYSHATATTVSMWSDGYTIWSKAVKYNNATYHHEASVSNYLYRNGAYIAGGQSGWDDPFAELTLATGFVEGTYNSTALGSIYCYLASAVVENTSAGSGSFKAGSSVLCLRKIQSNMSIVSYLVCNSGFWETATYQAVTGCNVRCAATVLMTMSQCSPLSFYYMVSSRWIEYQGNLECKTGVFNARPVPACTGGNCIEINAPF